MNESWGQLCSEKAAHSAPFRLCSSQQPCWSHRVTLYAHVMHLDEWIWMWFCITGWSFCLFYGSGWWAIFTWKKGSATKTKSILISITLWHRRQVSPLAAGQGQGRNIQICLLRAWGVSRFTWRLNTGSNASAVTSPLKSWSPQSHPWRLESTSSKCLDILTTSHESQMFLKCSLEVFNVFCPDPSEESLSMAAIALQNGFLQ